MSITTINLDEYQQRINAGESFDYVDVRSPGEFNRLHASPARSIPLAQFDAKALLAERADDAPPLMLLCQMGPRAQTAAQKIAAESEREIFVLEGGTAAWEKAGQPVVRGKGPIPLDRQMQITVGILIIAGVALGYWVSPWWLLLSGAVGAGLLNAGITGICPLAMGLAIMPWNRGSACGTSCSLPPRSDVADKA